MIVCRMREVTSQVTKAPSLASNLRIVLACFVAFVLLGSHTTWADYPSWRPSFAGEVAAVSGPDGTECWIATFFEWLEGLDWVPTDCPGTDEEHAITQDAGFFGYNSLLIGRVEAFKSKRKIKTGADVHVKASQPRSTGQLMAASKLYKWSGTAWTLTGSTGWRFNTSTTSHFTPTYNWGVQPTNTWYMSWSAGYQNTLAGWIGSTSTTPAVFLPCTACRAANPGPPPPLPPPIQVALPPPPAFVP